MREETDVSLLRIGAELGGRDHSDRPPRLRQDHPRVGRQRRAAARDRRRPRADLRRLRRRSRARVGRAPPSSFESRRVRALPARPGIIRRDLAQVHAKPAGATWAGKHVDNAARRRWTTPAWIGARRAGSPVERGRSARPTGGAAGTGCPRRRPGSAGRVPPPSGALGPPCLRAGPERPVHALHTMMMVMTDVEEWRKIRTPKTRLRAEPGSPRDRSPSPVQSWTRPALGVDLT